MISAFAQHRYQDERPPHERLRRAIWGIAYHVLFRTTPRWTLFGWRRQLLRLFGASIGAGCRISPTCRIWAPWNLSFGEYVAIGDEVDCYSVDKITIGSKVAVSQRTFLCTASHDVSSLRRPLVTRPIIIGEHAWVAAEAMVFPGVEIGTGTVVSARSVVTRNLPDWMICAGSPCRPIRQRRLAAESPDSGQSQST